MHPHSGLPAAAAMPAGHAPVHCGLSPAGFAITSAPAPPPPAMAAGGRRPYSLVARSHSGTQRRTGLGCASRGCPCSSGAAAPAGVLAQQQNVAPAMSQQQSSWSQTRLRCAAATQRPQCSWLPNPQHVQNASVADSAQFIWDGRAAWAGSAKLACGKGSIVTI